MRGERMETLKTSLWIAVGILAVDAIGFFAWVASGQYPADGFYIGTITAHILKLFI